MCNGIEFEKKADNTPNCPQIRPFKIFWQFYTKYYSLMPTVCNSIENMRKSGSRFAKTSRINVNALMGVVRQKLLLVGKEGLFET